MRIGTASIALLDEAIPEGKVIVRPEKMVFCPPGPHALPGVMQARVFQGNHWLCQVQTALGPVMVIRQNDSADVPPEGATVHLSWRAADMIPIGVAASAVAVS